MKFPLFSVSCAMLGRAACVVGQRGAVIDGAYFFSTVPSSCYPFKPYPFRSYPIPSYPRLSHFELSWHKIGWRRACVELARAVAGNSLIFSRPDNAAFDMTVHSAHRWNQVSVRPGLSKLG